MNITITKQFVPAMDCVSRNSVMTKEALSLCARVCQKYGAACDKHAQMEHCRKCAEVYWCCEQSCRQA